MLKKISRIVTSMIYVFTEEKRLCLYRAIFLQIQEIAEKNLFNKINEPLCYDKNRRKVKEIVERLYDFDN